MALLVYDGNDFQNTYNHRDFPRFGFTSSDDLIFNGFAGSDWVAGGLGNDRLNGNNGTNTDQIDQLTGWRGADTFVLNDFYGLQNNKGFAIIWDYNPFEGDRIEVIGSPSDYFFVEDNNLWLDTPPLGSSFPAGNPNTIIARADPIFGAVMIAAVSNVLLDSNDLSYTPTLNPGF
jgi:Ca2+-binding RTX toxin-like protein